MPGQKSKEELKENEGLVNQLSKQALKKVGEAPDPGGLYWVQLANWCLDNGELHLSNPDFLPQWEQYKSLSPAQAMDFLERGLDEEEPENLVEGKENLDPADLAALLLDHLDSRLSAEVPDYPRPLEANYLPNDLL